MKRIIIYIVLLAMMVVFSGCNLLGLSESKLNQNMNEENQNNNKEEVITNLTNQNEEKEEEDNDEDTVNQNKNEEIVTNNDTENNKNTDYENKDNDDIENNNQQNDKQDEINNNNVNENIEMTNLLVYYSEPDGYLVPITIEVPKTYQVATESINQMITSDETIKRAEKHGLFTVLPKGTKLIDISIDNKVATLNFNSNLLDYDSKYDEYNIIASIVYTMCGFSTVDETKILVDGEYPGKLEYGTTINKTFSKKDILINSNSINSNENKLKYDIYLVKPINNTEKLIPLSCEFEQTYSEKIPQKMLIELVRNYEAYNLYSQIPVDTEVISANLDQEGLLEVLLSQDINNYESGSAREIAIVNQLIYSFNEIEGVNKVKLSIENSDDVLKQGYELTEPFYVNKYINQVD